MLDYAQNTFSTFDHVCWATLFNKLGKMKEEAATISSDVVFRQLVDTFERRAESEGLDWIGVRELANAVHGLGAGLEVTSNVVFGMVGGVQRWAERLAGQANSQEIANVANAFGKVGFNAPVFFACLEREEVAKKIVKRGNFQEIANTVHAAAKLGSAAPVLCGFIEVDAERIVSAGSSQGAANIAWSMSRMRFECRDFFDCVVH